MNDYSISKSDLSYLKGSKWLKRQRRKEAIRHFFHTAFFASLFIALLPALFAKSGRKWYVSVLLGIGVVGIIPATLFS